MRTRGVAVLAFVLVALMACAGIRAQQQPKPAASAKKKQSEEVSVTAKYGRKNWDGKKTTLLKGDVKFTHGDTVLATEEVRLDEDAKIAVCPGKITITDPECDITSDKGTANLNKRVATLEGNVVMRMKPKQSVQKPSDDQSVREKFTQPTTITCPKLEYQYKAKIATGTGGVHFKQDKRTAQADKVIYDEKKELLTLTGNARGTDEDGQTFSAPKVIISLKEGDEWMEAPNATATFKIDLDDEEEAPEE